MGRLFWKFFTAFVLAQFAIFLTAGLMLLAWSPALLDAHVGMPFPPKGNLPPPLPLGAGLLVSLAFAAWLSWYFSRPIRSLNAAFEALANGKLDTRVGAAMGSRRDELADLGQAFDRSAAKLQSQVEAQRQLLHDVSHELRSPLARLQACCDLLVQQPDRAAELVKRIERESGRMDTLVGELLTLARLDSGAQQLRDDLIDLAEIVRTVCVDAQIELEAKFCVANVEADFAALVKGDGEMLHRAFDNIVRNAIRFTKPHSAIYVRMLVDKPARRISLHIADQGPGLPEKDLTSVFEPFYRGAPSAQPDGGGYGLGLAITRSIVQSHDGMVVARNRDGGGLEMVVSLPLALLPAFTQR